jgi:hypothetical protein
MDQHEINFLIAAVGTLGSVLGGCATWWINRVWSSMDSLQKQVSELHLCVAQNYVPRQELEKIFERIAKAQEETTKTMFAGFEDMRKEIAHISRNQATTRGLAEAVANLRRQE